MEYNVLNKSKNSVTTDILTSDKTRAKNIVKGSIVLCKRFSIVYICLFLFLVICIFLLCYFLSVYNLFYQNVTVYVTYKGSVYAVPYQQISNLAIGSIVPTSAILGVAIGVIDLLLLIFASNLLYQYNIKKMYGIYIALFIGVFLAIPSFFACFVLLIKCVKIKKVKN